MILLEGTAEIDLGLPEPQPRCIPALVPNVPKEAICTCKHLVADHSLFTRFHTGWEGPTFHRGHCMEVACRCRYYIHGEFRDKQ